MPLRRLTLLAMIIMVVVFIATMFVGNRPDHPTLAGDLSPAEAARICDEVARKHKQLVWKRRFSQVDPISFVREFFRGRRLQILEVERRTDGFVAVRSCEGGSATSAAPDTFWSVFYHEGEWVVASRIPLDH